MTDAPTASRRTLSFRTKLAIAIVLAGLVPLLTASIVSYVVARDALVESAEDRLSLMRDEKKQSLVDYFMDFAGTLRLLSASPVARDAILAMAEAWPRLPQEMGWAQEATTPPEAEGARRREASLRTLTEYHLAEAARAGASLGAAGTAGATIPTNPSAQAAQVLYLSENPNPADAKHLLVRGASDKTTYGEIHARLHAYASTIAKAQGWEDFLIVEAQSGFVVYSYAKRLDFATSVREGPYATTGLGRAARRALESAAGQEVYAEDFELYAASKGSATAFLASPVRVEGRTIGALVAGVPIRDVNHLLAPEAGAPSSTETFLVGTDHLMRTDSRFEAESTILRKSVDGLAVREALAGNTGIGVAPDYRGVDSILAWTPVKILGMPYGLVRKLDAAQALAPVSRLLRWMVGIAVVLLVLALLGGFWLSRSLSRPVARATERLQGMAQSLLSTAQEQQAGAAESAAAVEETRQTFQGVLGAAQNLRKVGTEVLANAEVSQRNAQTIGRRIQELSGSTANIGEILTLVKEIANRSDLLALNAALEGTKAGEAGRGFSLVATQMQRLAEEVMASVKKIEGLTRDISKASAGAVLAAEEADKVASHTTGSAQHIAEAVQTQQAATEQVSVAMNEIATVAQQSVEASRHIVSSSNELLGVAEDLRRVMGTRT